MTLDDLTLAERETHINQTADDRSLWTLTTDDTVWINKMDKLVASTNGAVTRTELGVGFSYTFPAKYLSVRKPKTLSEEQRKRLAAQLAAAREKQRELRVSGV